MRELNWLRAPLFLLACPALLSAQTVGRCPVFPSNNVWNTAIDRLPVHPNSSTFINTIGATRNVHADFGSGLWDGGPIGIPYVVVENQAKVSVSFDYSDESDPGPYPIPPNPPIEYGSDHHILIVDTGTCTLYELYDATRQPGGSWTAGSGAIFDLRSNALRPAGWTSADAAGLPMLPGLVRYDEAASGEIRHAIRFTVPQTRKEYVWPARHYASSRTGSEYPPMGLRFRLKASFDISRFSAINQAILRAMKTYGLILADNGSSWYISGVPDERWNNDDLHALDVIHGSDFEAVDSSSLMADPNSAQVRGSTAPTIAAVSNAASFRGAISPGSWVALTGTNLAATTRNWRADEIVNGALPTQLDGVRVTIGGVAAAVSYVSPAQVNVQAPDVPSGTNVPVVLGSATFPITLQTFAPGLFQFDTRYVAAQHAGYTPILAASPARPNETIILWGTGFGPSAPPQSAGRLVTSPAPLATTVTVYIGGVPAQVEWSGIAGAGLWQFNVKVPASLPTGDASVIMEVAGFRTQDNVFLPVAR